MGYLQFIFYTFGSIHLGQLYADNLSGASCGHCVAGLRLYYCSYTNQGYVRVKFTAKNIMPLKLSFLDI